MSAADYFLILSVAFLVGWTAGGLFMHWLHIK